MLELRDYSRAELIELYGTDRLDAIKAKVKRQGYTYENVGRGQSYFMRIQACPQDTLMKRYCIDQLGFDANTDFEKLGSFLRNVVSNEGFVTLQIDEMREELLKQGCSISPKTLQSYKHKIRQLGWTTYSYVDYVYFVFDKNQQHNRYISKEEYKEMYNQYWNTVRLDKSFDRAEREIKEKYGNKPRKRLKEVVNGIYSRQYNELIELINAEVK